MALKHLKHTGGMEGRASISFFTFYILNNAIKLIADANWCYSEVHCSVFKLDDLTSNNCENLPQKSCH